MNWWLKTRAPAAFLATVVLTTACAVLSGSAALPVPSLTGGTGSFLVGHLITVLPAAALMYAVSRTDTGMEWVAARPMHLWNTLLGLLAALVAVLAAAVTYGLTGRAIAFVVGRNTTGYLGLAMLLCALAGPRAAAVTTAALPVALAATGWAPDGRPRPWAWVLHPAHSGLAAGAALVLLTAGAAATAARLGPTALGSARLGSGRVRSVRLGLDRSGR
ncbi:hypothetical protein [Streptomyces sp. NPDC006691]|uniref:hypothetical protein n=1 Tax=Streptomyces sp. NPDC006691 TaxID=3364757 RepID=UPI00369C95DB